MCDKINKMCLKGVWEKIENDIDICVAHTILMIFDIFTEV